tara:strand:+ start:4642 stop:4998 length:357 start_codon:yes stop_codon:yes gene_type:complete
MSEENKENPEEVLEELQSSEEPVEPNSEEIIEVSWENVKPVFEHRQALSQTEDLLARVIIQFEKRKADLLQQSVRLESDMYGLAANLKDFLNIDPELTYEIKLPQNPGEKAYFIRKDN